MVILLLKDDELLQALAAHSSTNQQTTEKRRAHEAALVRVRKEAELASELAKAEAITPYRSRIESMQSHVDDLERRTIAQLQEKERTVTEQLSSSVHLHGEELRTAERQATQRIQVSYTNSDLSIARHVYHSNLSYQHVFRMLSATPTLPTWR